jgi:hypothetical protein
MTKVEKIYTPFIPHAKVRPGGEIFLKGDDAQQFVSACQRAGMSVLGIDAARIDSNGVLPYLDAIADYSPKKPLQWDAYQERSNRLAIDFLRKTMEAKGPDTYFSIVIWDAEEYAGSKGGSVD